MRVCNPMGSKNFAILVLYAAIMITILTDSSESVDRPPVRMSMPLLKPKPKPIPMLMPLPIPLRMAPPPRPLCLSQFALANHACSMVLPIPAPPPTPPSPPPLPPCPPPPPTSESPGGRHRHGHGHHHRHHSHHHRHRSLSYPASEDCCRWLKEVDAECVCDLLVYLPPFLAKPLHTYSVALPDTCNVTYSCGGRLKP